MLFGEEETGTLDGKDDNDREECGVSSGERPAMGWRERKKIKTRATIQQHAVRLFKEQGYHATTIEQIAEAAEISPSTFFRYFSTKEAVVLEDDYDPLLIQAYRDQPPDASPLQALRSAVRHGMASLPEEEWQAAMERMELSISVPELRAASLNQLLTMMELIAELVAERIGCDAGDFRVQTLAGAVIGVFTSAQAYMINNPEADHAALFDEALAHLEAGLPLPPAAPQGTSAQGTSRNPHSAKTEQGDDDD